MANTQGFEVVAELRESALKQLLLAAWKSGGDTSAEGVIPEKIDIPGPSFPGPLNFGPYTIKKGHIQIPKEQLDLTMDPPVNGLLIKLGTIVHIEIDNPPIDSAKLFDITADARIRTPLSARNNTEIVADFTNLPANAVDITLTSGDPIAPLMNSAVEEFIHQKYQDETIPHAIDPIPLTVPFGNISMNCRVEFYDDASQPGKQIQVSNPNVNKLKVSIPCYLKFYDITGGAFGFSLQGPMGVTGIAEMVADYDTSNNVVSAKLSTAVVELVNLVPAPGIEGSNYTFNKNAASIVGMDLDGIIIAGFNSGAAAALKNIGDVLVNIPSLDQIEAFAADVVRKELEHRAQIQIWHIEEIDGTDTPINNVIPHVLSDCLAICINNMGAGNPGALMNFIPASRDFGIATSKEKVRNAFLAERDERYPELKAGNSHTFSDKIEGKTVRLNSLDLKLESGHMEINGDVTIVDAIAGSINVSASFSQKVSLLWDPSGSSPQEIKHQLDGDPDVSMGAAAWLLSALIGFVTFGVVGVIVALIIMAVVESVASQVGGQVAKDESGKLSSLGAWPGTLDKIGNVRAHFHNPVGISSSGLLFAGQMVITSMHELTNMDMARSHGPYLTSGNIPVQFNGGTAQQTSQAKWILGDGAQANQRNLSHRYGKSGMYIAHVEIKVNEEGGVTTEHYTKVQVKNVVPQVWFNQFDIQIKEGEELELIAHFTDDNWLDTHAAVFDFGDNTARENATIVQTNNEPQASGTATVKHTWCDNGIFDVKVYVQDSAGGIGEAQIQVVVANVPPRIIAPSRICVMRHQPVQLEAIFVDPGWCDTYVATWDTGDGHSKMATIKEVRMADYEFGFASVSHIYHCLGSYVACVTVTDDDGGQDQARVLITVTELMNANFENGFRWLLNKERYDRETGSGYKVANEWFPFLHPLLSYTPSTSTHNHVAEAYLPASMVGFDADEFIVRNGQRSQVVKLQMNGIAGIYQSLCANEGWDYELSVYYHLPMVRGRGNLLIGLDPTGGTSADNLEIAWVEGLPSFEWLHASVRVKAKADKITCFIGLMQIEGSAELYLDKAALFMIQPLYARPKRNRKQDDACCDVEQLDRHNFKELQRIAERKVIVRSEPESAYIAQPTGVRFLSGSDNRDGSSRQPMLRMSNNSQSMVSTILDGLTNVGGTLLKQGFKSGVSGLRTFLASGSKENPVRK